MKLQQYRYICEPFGHSFLEYNVPETSYGEFIARSSKNEPHSVNADADATFDEFSSIVRSVLATDVNARQINRVFHQTYGLVACDRSPSGLELILSAHPPCPRCGSQKMRSWEPVGPLIEQEHPFPPVTHNIWEGLSRDEKKRRVADALATQKA